MKPTKEIAVSDHEMMKNFKEIYDKELDLIQDYCGSGFIGYILGHSHIRMFCYEITINSIKDYIKRTKETKQELREFPR